MPLLKGRICGAFGAFPRLVQLGSQILRLRYEIGKLLKVVLAALDFFVEHYLVEALLARGELLRHIELVGVRQRDGKQRLDSFGLRGLYAL